MHPRKILLISHDGSRTGAPILLLNLGKVLKLKSINIDFLIKKPGPLAAEFQLIGKTFTAYRSATTSYFRKFISLFSKKKYTNISDINWNDYDCIISNTITNGDIISEIKKKFKGVILCYVHELEMGTKFFTSSNNLQKLITCTDGYLYPSNAVKQHLLTNLNIESSKLAFLPYYILPSRDSQIVRQTKNETFVVGGVGTIDWRKSPDIFILIANIVIKELPGSNIIFKWLGAFSGIELDRLNYDINKLGLNGKIIFLEQSSDSQSFYNCIDLLLLTSREDPYPLVVLEAANAQVPTICFENAGGASEFINSSNGGFTVPYLDINAMADKIIFYFKNSYYRIDDGKNAQDMIINTHQNATYIHVKFLEALKLFLN